MRGANVESVAAELRNCAGQTPGTDGQRQCKHNNRVMASAFQRSGLNLLLVLPAPGRSETGAYSKPELHKNKGFFLDPGTIHEIAPGVTHGYLHSRYRRARGNRIG